MTVFRWLFFFTFKLSVKCQIIYCLLTSLVSNLWEKKTFFFVYVFVAKVNIIIFYLFCLYNVFAFRSHFTSWDLRCFLHQQTVTIYFSIVFSCYFIDTNPDPDLPHQSARAIYSMDIHTHTHVSHIKQIKSSKTKQNKTKSHFPFK